jgi:hypothetical protein
MSIAEMFLLVWAGVATVIALKLQSKGNEVMKAHMETTVLLAEVVTGEVVPTKDANDVWTVENNDVYLRFKAKERDNHGL